MKHQKPRRKAGHAGLRQNPTLVANPAPRSRVKRNPKNVAPRGIQSGFMSFKKNPIDSLKVAGIPVVPVALGAAAALALTSAISAVPQVKGVKQDVVRSLIPAAATLAAGYAIFKFVQNPTLRMIGGYLASTGIVLAVNELAGKHIGDAVGGMFKQAPAVTSAPSAPSAATVAVLAPAAVALAPAAVAPVTAKGFGSFGDIPYLGGGSFGESDVPHFSGFAGDFAGGTFGESDLPAMSGYVAGPPTEIDAVMGSLDLFDDAYAD